MSIVVRPGVEYDDAKHTYTYEGEKLMGVSTVAKVGEDEAFGIASAWGFRLGYEGAHDILFAEHEPKDYTLSKDELREALKRAGLTPWSKRDKGAARGTWVHDVLEHLAQHGGVPPAALMDTKEGGYVRAVLQWYLDYRPEFVSTEVQVASTEHLYAGRYDIRCWIDLARFKDDNRPKRDVPGPALCLVDLKTSKGVYPTTHYPQLAGYELASREMGFPPTDGQFVLNVKEDATYEFKLSNATPEHFIAYLGAARAVKDLHAKNPTRKGRRK